MTATVATLWVVAVLTMGHDWSLQILCHYWLSRWLIQARSWGTWGSSDGWLAGAQAMGCSMALSKLPENSTAVWRSFYSISSFLPSFHTSLKALLPLFAHLYPPQEFPSINLMFILSHCDVCFLVDMWLVQSCSVTCLNIVRFDVLTCYLDFPIYFHMGAQLIVFFSSWCLCLVLMPRWYCPWSLVEFI